MSLSMSRNCACGPRKHHTRAARRLVTKQMAKALPAWCMGLLRRLYSKAEAAGDYIGIIEAYAPS